jgi:threonine dehydrogenase-like Zn-dependent dehydrogenase
MKALVLNAVGHGFDFEDVEIASPSGREVLVDVQASGLCHTDLLFATHDIVPTPSVLGHEVAGIVAAIGTEARDGPPAHASRGLTNTRRSGRDQRHDRRSAGPLGRIQILRHRP